MKTRLFDRLSVVSQRRVEIQSRALRKRTKARYSLLRSTENSSNKMYCYNKKGSSTSACFVERQEAYVSERSNDPLD